MQEKDWNVELQIFDMDQNRMFRQYCNILIMVLKQTVILQE